jgi:hypothetical protein
MSLAPLGLAPTGSLAPVGSPIANTGLRLGTPLPADLAVSFEFFPPKTEKMEQTLWQAVHKLAPLQPEFVSVTYGAGGSTRERTHATVSRLVRETHLKPAAHLTCVAATKAEIAERQSRIAVLQDELANWQDEEYVKTQARQRLGWVVPGEIGYKVVDANGKPLGGGAEISVETTESVKPPEDAWWAKLWGSVAAADQPAPAARDAVPDKPITEKSKPR